MEQHWLEICWLRWEEGFWLLRPGRISKKSKGCRSSIGGAQQQWGPNRAPADHFVTNPDQIWAKPAHPISCYPAPHPLIISLPTFFLFRQWFSKNYQNCCLCWVLPIKRGLWSGCLPCTVEINWNSWACCISRLLQVSWICRPGNIFSQNCSNSCLLLLTYFELMR